MNKINVVMCEVVIIGAICLYINYYLLLLLLKKTKRRNTTKHAWWCEVGCQLFCNNFYICSSVYSFKRMDSKIFDSWPRINISFIHTRPSYDLILCSFTMQYTLHRQAKGFPPVEEIMFTCKEVHTSRQPLEVLYVPQNGFHYCCHLYIDFTLILGRKVWSHIDMHILLSLPLW